MRYDGKTGPSMPAGFVAGAVATVCMSALMLASKALGGQGKPAPKKITEKVIKAVDERPSAAFVNTMTVGAHLGYGMAGGALFALAERKWNFRCGRICEGIAFGLGVWLVSYFGWVPALGFMPTPAKDEPGRQRTTFSAHLVYGVVLGEVMHRLEQTHLSPHRMDNRLK